ncbi:hypothetical protein NBH08_08380 [Faecalicatena sp. BF-R-105]|nr:hypothetical protein [Faecalicatena sp. BF-R-105]
MIASTDGNPCCCATGESSKVKTNRGDVPNALSGKRVKGSFNVRMKGERKEIGAESEGFKTGFSFGPAKATVPYDNTDETPARKKARFEVGKSRAVPAAGTAFIERLGRGK